MPNVPIGRSAKNNHVVNWGILGCAQIAEKAVAPGMQLSPNGELYAVASRTTEKARKFAAKFGAQIAYGSYEELLKDPKVQAVYIPLPNSMHKDWTVLAAESGKHVLCEKPLASSAAEAQEMVDACRRNNVLLMEAFQYRLHPQLHAVKKIIDEGRIGKVVGVTSVHSSSKPKEGNIRIDSKLGGGPLGDKGSYCVSIARFFLGEPIRVFARGDFDKDGMDWRVTADLEFSDGRMAWLDTSHKLAEDTYYQGCEVFGERGRISILSPFAQRATLENGEIVDTSFLIFMDRVLAPETEEVRVKGVQQWQLEVEYFADRILKKESIDYPMENGLAQTKVLDAIYKSAREERAVNL